MSIAGESFPDKVSEVIFLTITSNKIPVFLNFEMFYIHQYLFFYKYNKIIVP